MPDVSLPSGSGVLRAPRGPGARGGRGFKPQGGSRGRQGPRLVAHDIEDNRKARTEDVVTSESREKTFEDLLLSGPVLQGLNNSGFVRPSPVQLQAIPRAKVGFDCIVQSKSGTGKTCVYVVTALEMVKPDLSALQVLVLAPTREIAVQGVTVAQQIGQQMQSVKIQAFIGGLSLAEDKVRARTCQIAVGTPGRVKQLISEGILSVDNVRLGVLDEADKMLEPSFINDTTWILNSLPISKQVLALSATYPDKLASLAERFMRSPQHIRPGQSSQVLTGVAQYLLEVAHCPAQHKQNTIKQTALLSLLSSLPYTQVLVFSNYTSIAQATADFLNSRGFPAVYMSAVQDQARRMAVMETFRQFNTRILCSTDLTARGIDAENVNLVISMEVPWDHNTYLHRIGRGGRFGSHSVAVTLASKGQELDRMRGIVGKTGGEVRIMDAENIPKNLGKERDSMEILSGEIKQEEEKEKHGDDESQKTQEQTEKPKKKPSRSRVKKKNDDNNPSKSQEEEDTSILKNYVDFLKTEPSQNRISYDEALAIAQKMAKNEPFDKIDIQESPRPSEATLENVGKAIKRLAKSREQEFDNRLEIVRSKTKDMNIDEMLELLGQGGGYSSIVKEDESVTAPKVPQEPEIEIIPPVSKPPPPPVEVCNDTSDSDSSSGSSDSESDSESDSDSDSSEEEEVSYSHQPPSLPSAPSAAWYRHWYAAVHQQRQALQTREYYAYLQHMGYYS